MKKPIRLNIYLGFIVLVALIYSCSNSDNVSLTYLNYEQATSIFIKNYLEKPDTIYLSKFKDYFAV